MACACAGVCVCVCVCVFVCVCARGAGRAILRELPGARGAVDNNPKKHTKYRAERPPFFGGNSLVVVVGVVVVVVEAVGFRCGMCVCWGVYVSVCV